jgi:hypothetical protein
VIDPRQRLVKAITDGDFCVCGQQGCPTPESMVDDYRDAVAVQLGRECMEMGLLPFLERLVGEANTTRLFERHAEESYGHD